MLSYTPAAPESDGRLITATGEHRHHHQEHFVSSLGQGRLNTWAQWAIAWGPNKHRGPTSIGAMLMCVC